ncbi:Lar family restriction alleviation protein [Paraburkholderia acidisoli]|uniref:Restriction alleviation protein, Lar family n=1 Tax=Paraburkholderia acidisoli TaxID=2571748 RepID=A0A7Z2GR74_9BURK|nr:Lar family restriction alleviation protein [Paraburkholderia acidisoli]QGZ66321.1 restriction alleviation protein, Lar family [Paraburkholderia acidisoli]QGZ66405.1 restriction alleviation protein, Lar family [Paraburkholderia acidisoli]
MDAKELKPCPFCRSSDVWTESALGKRQVLCNSCEASGPTEETDDEAIDSWNRLAAIPSDAAQAPIIAWVRADDPTDAVSDAKKRGMIESAGAPGKKLAACYSVPAYAAPVAPAAAAPKLVIDGKPTEKGIYAWIVEGSAALVHVHKRPTDHSPGNVLNGSLIHNCAFYDGCAIDQWTGGTWYGPLKHPAAPTPTVAADAAAPSLTQDEIDMLIHVLPEHFGLDRAQQIINALKAAPAPAAQPDERADALQDMAFVNGVQAGYKFGLVEDHAAYEKCIAARDGYLKVLRETSATIQHSDAQSERQRPVAWECASPIGEKPALAFLTSKAPTREHYEAQGWRVTPLYLAAHPTEQRMSDAERGESHE